MKSHLLIISHELVNRQMAGAAIRSWELAGALSGACDVSLAVPFPSSVTSPQSFRALVYRVDDWTSLKSHIEAADCILFSPHLFNYFPELLTCSKPVIIDGYDPVGLEVLMMHFDDDPNIATQAHQPMLKCQRMALAVGDFFICASERQRNWWLGALEVAGRINPYTMHNDPMLRALVDIVPFGIPAEPPAAKKPVLRGVVDGIGHEDLIVLWGGGLWQWLDPLTLIRAAGLLVSELPNLRVVFPGARAPRLGGASSMPISRDAVALAESSGLINRHVFFGDWVDYANWPGYLVESDIAVSLHWQHIETYLSWRTRVLSYVWAGLPMVLSQGDELAERVAKAGIAILTPVGDERAVADAIRTWAQKQDLRTQVRSSANELQQSLSWPTCIEPLRRFAERPSHAPDKMHVQTSWLYSGEQAAILAEQLDAAQHQAHILQIEADKRLALLNEAGALLDQRERDLAFAHQQHKQDRQILQHELDIRLEALTKAGALLDQRERDFALAQQQHKQEQQILQRELDVRLKALKEVGTLLEQRERDLALSQQEHKQEQQVLQHELDIRLEALTRAGVLLDQREHDLALAQEQHRQDQQMLQQELDKAHDQLGRMRVEYDQLSQQFQLLKNSFWLRLGRKADQVLKGKS